MPTLTLRIEENSPEHQNLEKVKEIFNCSTNTSAIYKALQYASEKEELRKTMLQTANEYREVSAKMDTMRRKIREYNRIQEQLLEFSNEE